MILSSFPVFSLKPRNSLHSPSKLNHEDHSFLRKSTVIANHKPKRRCDLYDLHREVVPYGEAWSWQNAIVKEKKELNVKNEDSADTLIVLQHSPVYTLGAGSSEEYLNFDAKNAPFDLYRTERGGEVTYHGPGQLVMYPIINLRYQQMDLHWYLRTLEEVVIRALFSTFAIEASRVAGLTGVWVGNKKLAAIGIKVTQWIAYHGLALNVSTDLIPFQRIVPCGIRDREVGSIKELIVRDHPYIDDRELIEVTYDSLLTEFSEVFQLDLSVVRHNRSVSSEKQSNTKGQIQHPEQSLRA